MRITTRTQAHRAEIEGVGAECWIGTPDRLGTLRAALESVTLVCWLLGTATGTAEELRELHGARLRSFVAHTIDTTVRGFVYEVAEAGPRDGANGAGAPAGERIVSELAQRNAIPAAFLRADPADGDAWVAEARAAIAALLG